jgi:hypothetical protein
MRSMTTTPCAPRADLPQPAGDQRPLHLGHVVVTLFFLTAAAISFCVCVGVLLVLRFAKVSQYLV